ncbi:MAG: hypothetical protein LQ340_007115 [Diploschistes diacapsis]|nr:MAG: hypothetical protein LQ340_007115 [Diploschistes diacapsis]
MVNKEAPDSKNANLRSAKTEGTQAGIHGSVPTLNGLSKGKKRFRDGNPKRSSWGVAEDIPLQKTIRESNRQGHQGSEKSRHRRQSHAKIEVDASPLAKMDLFKDPQHMIQDVEIVEARNGDSKLALQDSNPHFHPGLRKQHYLKSTPADSSLTPALILEPRPDWFNAILPEVEAEIYQSPNVSVNSGLLAYARELLLQENQHYAETKRSSSSNKFYLAIIVSGTLADKVSALTLSIQESPLHNMQALENLIGLARKRNRSQAMEVLGALKDLFSAGSVLPSDRRLRAFASQPALAAFCSKSFEGWDPSRLLPSPIQKAHLVIWAFEDWLKSTYFEIIKILEVWGSDEIVYSRVKAVEFVYDLLREKPEQEANLLHLLVNKLGDPEKKIASKASSSLVQLQLPHPFMKTVIISTIESAVLFKQGQRLHAKYYAVITLNQTVLNGNQPEVVTKVLEIYFALFLLLLGGQASPSSGVPVANQNSKPRGKSAAKTRQAGNDGMASRRAGDTDHELEEKILSAILTGINRAFPFASSNDAFFEKNLDILFRITHSSNFNTSLQALMLIQQLCSSHIASTDRFYRTLYESLLDPRLLTTSKQTLYINLLFRALEADIDTKRVQAFVKRIAQTSAMHQPAFACAAFYLIKQLENTFPIVHTLIDQPENLDNNETDGARNRVNEGAHASVTRTDSGQVRDQRYNGRKRDPQFTSADRSCLWEMVCSLIESLPETGAANCIQDPILHHFHPSVSLFASKLLLPQDKIATQPDLTLHTLIAFLDRFVYRNPKKPASGLHGTSVMQPHAATDGSDGLMTARSQYRYIRAPINSLNSESNEESETAPDEIFFHQYFNAKARNKDNAHKKPLKQRKLSAMNDGTASKTASDDEEEEIWKALIDSRPELEADEAGALGIESDLSDITSIMGDGNKALSASSDTDSVSNSEGFKLDDEQDDVWASDNELSGEDVGKIEGVVEALIQDGPQKAQKRRKTLKDLPIFASADEYAELLQDKKERDN